MKKNDFIYFIPLILFYTVFILLRAESQLDGDETRYMSYVENLLQGFYASPDNPSLRNGPGYPLFLLPFVYLNIPLVVPKLFNGLFLFFAVYLFYKTLIVYKIPKKTALFTSYFLGLYPPMYKMLPILYTEALVLFLICTFLYYTSLFLKTTGFQRRYFLISAFALGILALTKVIFGLVILASLFLAILGWIWFRSPKFSKSIALLVVGFLIFAPYLFYTYTLTGKVFYSGTQGGEILYFRTSPYENEYGDWLSNRAILEEDYSLKKKNTTIVGEEQAKNHRAFYIEIQHLTYVQRDSVFKQKAMENLRNHPKKYLKNTLANLGRLFFNYPLSHRLNSLGTFQYIIPNMFILVFLIMCIYPAFLARKRIPFELYALLVFISIYLFGVILLLAKARYLIVAVPILLLFIVYILTNILSISFKKESPSP